LHPNNAALKSTGQFMGQFRAFLHIFCASIMRVG
jgi:hypothetical protein